MTLNYTPEEVDQIEEQLLNAPGAAHPIYDMPKPLATPLSERLRRADQKIKRCRWCGAQTIKQDRLCNHCRANGYPIT